MDIKKNKDICITRTKGEDFSLLVEIVRSKKVIRLFDDRVNRNSYESKKSNTSVKGRKTSKFNGKILIGNIDANMQSPLTPNANISTNTTKSPQAL